MEDIPVIEELMESSDELEKERIRWAYINKKMADKKRNGKLNKEEMQLLNRTTKWISDNNLVITREDKT